MQELPNDKLNDKAAQNVANITRLEVIDHRDKSPSFGRAFVAHGVSITLSLQDDGKTLKVFVNEQP